MPDTKKWLSSRDKYRKPKADPVFLYRQTLLVNQHGLLAYQQSNPIAIHLSGFIPAAVLANCL